MTNFFAVATQFLQVVADGFTMFFEMFVTYNVRQFMIDVINFDPVEYLSFVPTAFWEMSLIVAVFGSGVLFILTYNLLKWAFGIITGS